ncbi:MAG: right-handed parallel beta-helix repeat-containing protein [Prevotella sp.]|nr:right-handed parallel beta-helix repeat-containing protein [Prevotella sp.]
MIRLTLTSLALLVCSMASAQFTTAGDGTTYSIDMLAHIGDAGIVVYEAEDTPGYRLTYTLTKSITVAAGDKFKMDDGVTVHFDHDVTLAIEGEADFQLTAGSCFDGVSGVYDGDVLGSAVRIKSTTTTEIENCTFYYVGLELMAEGATNVRHCNFFSHDGSTAAAVYFISAGAESTIENCYFEECRKAAIGSAANACQSLIIKDCQLVKNSRANNNVPQINITAASHLEITDCEVAGDPEDVTANSMVGGIGISNFYGYADTNVSISGCNIAWNRYGIGTVGPVSNLRIENCTLTDNNHEQNPMNGGSGISLYDPYQQTQAVIAGNHIEGSLWGITIIGCKDVNLGQPGNDGIDSPGGNVFVNNGNGGQLYDLYNNSTLTVYAQNNTWNVSEQNEEQIETVIFHKADDASLGEVIYWPAAQPSALNPPSSTFSPQPSAIYDLQGRKIVDGQPLRGIYIINGKKVVY